MVTMREVPAKGLETSRRTDKVKIAGVDSGERRGERSHIVGKDVELSIIASRGIKYLFCRRESNIYSEESRVASGVMQKCLLVVEGSAFS